MTDEITDSELWRAYRQDRQQRRAARLPVRSREIAALQVHGFRVRELTPYHFRVEGPRGTVDLFPTNRRFHVLHANLRGSYRDALQLVRRWA